MGDKPKKPSKRFAAADVFYAPVVKSDDGDGAADETAISPVQPSHFENRAAFFQHCIRKGKLSPGLQAAIKWLSEHPTWRVGDPITKTLTDESRMAPTTLKRAAWRLEGRSK